MLGAEAANTRALVFNVKGDNVVVGAIRALADRERDPSLVLDAFLLRAMTHAGWAPAITDCARCAAPGPHRAFSVAGGGAVLLSTSERHGSPASGMG